MQNFQKLLGMNLLRKLGNTVTKAKYSGAGSG